MLTGRAALLRPDINHLRVRPIYLDVEQAPKTAAPGEFAATLRSYGRLKNGERAKASRARNSARDIPTSGQARRRAKAIRNRAAALGSHVSPDINPFKDGGFVPGAPSLAIVHGGEEVLSRDMLAGSAE